MRQTVTECIRDQTACNSLSVAKIGFNLSRSVSVAFFLEPRDKFLKGVILLYISDDCAFAQVCKTYSLPTHPILLNGLPLERLLGVTF